MPNEYSCDFSVVFDALQSLSTGIEDTYQMLSALVDNVVTTANTKITGPGTSTIGSVPVWINENVLGEGYSVSDAISETGETVLLSEAAFSSLVPVTSEYIAAESITRGDIVELWNGRARPFQLPQLTISEYKEVGTTYQSDTSRFNTVVTGPGRVCTVFEGGDDDRFATILSIDGTTVTRVTDPSIELNNGVTVTQICAATLSQNYVAVSTTYNGANGYCSVIYTADDTVASTGSVQIQSGGQTNSAILAWSSDLVLIFHDNGSGSVVTFVDVSDPTTPVVNGSHTVTATTDGDHQIIDAGNNRIALVYWYQSMGPKALMITLYTVDTTTSSLTSTGSSVYVDSVTEGSISSLSLDSMSCIVSGKGSTSSWIKKYSLIGDTPVLEGTYEFDSTYGLNDTGQTTLGAITNDLVVAAWVKEDSSSSSWSDEALRLALFDVTGTPEPVFPLMFAHGEETYTAVSHADRMCTITSESVLLNWESQGSDHHVLILGLSQPLYSSVIGIASADTDSGELCTVVTSGNVSISTTVYGNTPSVGDICYMRANGSITTVPPEIRGQRGYPVFSPAGMIVGTVTDHSGSIVTGILVGLQRIGGSLA